MLLPERLTPTSIICVKRDVEVILETLSDFGEFHIKETREDSATNLSEYKANIQKLRDAINDIDDLTKQFADKKNDLFGLFKNVSPTKSVVVTNDWHTLTESTIQKISSVKNETVEVKNLLNDLNKEKEQLEHIKDELSSFEAIKEIDDKLKVNSEKEKELTDKLRKIGEENKKQFVAWKETSENILLLLNTKMKVLESGPYATIEGFTPQKKFNTLCDILNKKIDGKVIVSKTDPPKQDHKNHAKTMPPTKMSNNKFVKPFEELTKLYGLPKYNEIDPTPIMAITFPILFGLMFGDLGHGLLLLIGGLTVGKLLKNNQGMKNLCYIMAACGVAACITGALFGEFFGQAIFAPLWFSPFHGAGVSTFLIYCLYVGVAQIMIGLALEMGNFIVNHKIADAVLTSIPKMAFFMGGVYILYTYWLDFGAWLNGPILLAIIPFIILAVGKPIYLAIAKPANPSGEHEEMDKISNRLFDGGDFFIRLLGNTISYARILALLMAHWALMLAVGAIAGLIGTASILHIILSTVIIIFGNIFVLALEGLIVFIHTLRLHFYEWFSKFYIGSGTAFTPFKLKHTYTEVIFEKEKTHKEKQDTI